VRVLPAGHAPDSRERCDEMASGGKKKTTMAKLARESRLRERRLDKQARKLARKHAAAQASDQPGDHASGGLVEDDHAPENQ
jgi:hypothetical protein